VTRILIDTGPIVALLNRRNPNHRWVREVLDTLAPPVFTCEAVVSEACFLLAQVGADHAVLDLLANDVLRIDFQLRVEIDAVRALRRKFADVPMSLADACLVRMSELDSTARVLTLDSDFVVYRKNRRQVIPTLMPARRRR
jgi:predicted nucleic acid-binding protein